MDKYRVSAWLTFYPITKKQKDEIIQSSGNIWCEAMLSNCKGQKELWFYEKLKYVICLPCLQQIN